MHYSLIFPSEEEFHQNNCRYYAATTADLDGDGKYEIIGVGQVNGEKPGYSGLVSLLKMKASVIQEYEVFSFRVSLNGKKLPTRIRSISLKPGKRENQWDLFLVGRGGDDESGAGFLYQALIKDGKISKVGEIIIKHEDAKANHGYPLAIANLDEDEDEELIYGGFFIKAENDWADVRVFGQRDGALLEYSRPFDKLNIPFRVNAIDAGDIDNDGKNDIIIAGRTKKTDGHEYSAIAWWSKGKLNHHVFLDNFQSRLRTVLIKDLDGDKRNEFLTGGRIELGSFWLADLRVWRLENGRLKLLDQFFWSPGKKIRLRTITRLKEPLNHIKVGGRVEWLAADGDLRWKGFIWEFSLRNDQLCPMQSPRYYNFGNDTRVRHLHLTETGDIVASGFTKGKKDTGFISLITCINEK